MMPSVSLEKRLWGRIDKRGPDECWEWLGGRNIWGYGQINEGRKGGKQRSAHRIVWELTFGPIPAGEGYHGTCVLHRCDNRGCCNPAHLFLGTNADNAKDRGTKGRQARGERNGGAKLNDNQVREIRAAIEAGNISKALQQQYGVSKSTISHIKVGRHWGHL